MRNVIFIASLILLSGCVKVTEFPDENETNTCGANGANVCFTMSGQEFHGVGTFNVYSSHLTITALSTINNDWMTITLFESSQFLNSSYTISEQQNEGLAELKYTKYTSSGTNLYYGVSGTVSITAYDFSEITASFQATLKRQGNNVQTFSITNGELISVPD